MLVKTFDRLPLWAGSWLKCNMWKYVGSFNFFNIAPPSHLLSYFPQVCAARLTHLHYSVKCIHSIGYYQVSVYRHISETRSLTPNKQQWQRNCLLRGKALSRTALRKVWFYLPLSVIQRLFYCLWESALTEISTECDRWSEKMLLLASICASSRKKKNQTKVDAET